MKAMITCESVIAAIQSYAFPAPSARPYLLFGAADLPALRDRAARRKGLVEGARNRASARLETPAERIDPLQPYISGSQAVEVAHAYAMTADPSCAAWAKTRVAALLGMDSWFSPVHVGACRVCDHVMANMAAQVAVVHDLLGDCYSPQESAEVAAGVRRLHFEPFLEATSGTDREVEWWFRRRMPSNWKIMTCGESGLAVCAFFPWWPEAREGLARAAKGVIEVLDDVPSDGDWPEGVHYWFHTLWMGLRFARAMTRLTGGAIDIFMHPVLRVTGDFAVMLTTPSGRVYNFNDCREPFDELTAEALIMLAAASRRKEWMWVARRFPAPTLLFLACDDESLSSQTPQKTCACFPATGVATLRAGWDKAAAFVGFKSGSSEVGHSHLDANSFIVEMEGQRLVDEYSYWPQAHFLGFFDCSERRWNFDANATVGHNTLLVDGQGQRWGYEYRGEILEARDEGPYSLVIGNASRAYPGLLLRFVRTILLIKPDILVIRDLLECDGARHVEWLLHYAGSIRTEGASSIIESGGVALCVTPFLPDRSSGWRVSDVERTSVYEDSDARREVTRRIRYRSFAPFGRAKTLEFLFGLRRGTAGGEGWRFDCDATGWRLRPSGSDLAARPAGDSVVIEPSGA